MPLTIVVTAGDPAANSYADVATAEAYFAARVHAEAWTDGASPDDKARALAAATARLDQEAYAGCRATATQRLAWPRAFVRDADAAAGADSYLPTDAIPRALADATCAQALALLNETADPAAPSGLEGFKELTVGDLTLVPREDGPPAATGALCPDALRLLRPYLAGRAGAVRLERA